MTLRELQERFQAGVLAGLESGETAILDSLRDSPRADRKTLFGVYVDAYRLRLAEFISNDFPTLREFMGDDAFGALVEAYIAAAPSRHRNARWYAWRLPEFMRESPQWRSDRAACDLALFERGLADAFDAADAPTLAIDALAATEAEDWPRLVFEFHPSVATLDLAKGVARLYGALVDGEEAERPDQESVETILIWRRDDEPVYREIGEDERLALIEARDGKSFGDICTLLEFQNNDETLLQRAAGFLAQWFTDGLVTRISLSA
ncbi:DNA-binding domain-containing protein [Methylosinus sp. PW1]|uniref:HvfC/BufC N-terminal domain-containing protein n=1 Tax=Methylosinus sp. PW1 TaxID=107636 RepID=UPI00056C41DE|nr:DNA-binding domain-containing protein [Methylosinus sp. PW1]